MTVFPSNISSSTLPPAPTVTQPEFYLEANNEIVNKLYEEWKAKKAKAGTQQKIFNSCSCVVYAEWKAGIDLPQIGMAKNLKTNSSWPSVGSIVKTNESYAGHLAVITAIEGNILTIAESNYLPCREGSRQLRIDDPRILGYFEGVN